MIIQSNNSQVSAEGNQWITAGTGRERTGKEGIRKRINYNCTVLLHRDQEETCRMMGLNELGASGRRDIVPSLFQDKARQKLIIKHNILCIR